MEISVAEVRSGGGERIVDVKRGMTIFKGSTCYSRPYLI